MNSLATAGLRIGLHQRFCFGQGTGYIIPYICFRDLTPILLHIIGYLVMQNEVFHFCPLVVTSNLRYLEAIKPPFKNFLRIIIANNIIISRFLLYRRSLPALKK